MRIGNCARGCVAFVLMVGSALLLAPSSNGATSEANETTWPTVPMDSDAQRFSIERYDNQALFPTFCVTDYESLLVRLAEIGVRPHRDDLNKRAFVVWHQLPDVLVVKAESFDKEDWGSIERREC